jgi:serine/threonine protein phosphatase 1
VALVHPSKTGTVDMNILVIGDVHGCLNSLRALLQNSWGDNDIFIQLGDLIDRGKYSGETVQFIQTLQNQNSDRVVVLRGNHEQELIEYEETGLNSNWLRQGGSKTIESFLNIGISLKEISNWMKEMPLTWENDNIFVSHAGISQTSKDPLNPHHPDSVVWTRQQLKNIGKIQIVGHTPTRSGKPEYEDRSNSWNIDTGACFSGRLSAIKLTPQGTVIDTYCMETHAQDI